MILHIFMLSLMIQAPQAAQASAFQVGERLTLERAVAEALAHNRDLIAARADISVVASRLTTARLRPNPTVEAAADHLDLLGTRFSELNGAGPTECSIAAEFPWERREKRERRIEVAEKEQSIAAYELQDTVRRMTFETQSGFVDVMLAQESLTLARENFSALSRISEINASRVSAGDLAQVELMRTKVAALQLQNAVSQAEWALRAARNRLGLIIGRGPEAILEAAGDFRSDTAVLTAADMERIAFTRRPDLLAARAEEERAAADVGLQAAQSRGDVTLGTEYRRQQGVNGAGNSLGFVASIPLPFFDRNQGELERAYAEQNRAMLKTAAIQALVRAEIRAALDQCATARTQLDRIESIMLDQARQVRDITQYTYERGEASFLQLLDAQRAYNDTMQSYFDARAEYARSLYWIDAVSGK
jgi:cobalt-zinc-cadmium efflux system outer membrane protein